MTTRPADAGATLFQLTVQGVPIPDSVEQARTLHNETAGADASVAAARSLGDLSHNVYTPVGTGGFELLFLDTWNSMEGLGQFFANPQVIESAGQLRLDAHPGTGCERPGDLESGLNGAHRRANGGNFNEGCRRCWWRFRRSGRFVSIAGGRQNSREE